MTDPRNDQAVAPRVRERTATRNPRRWQVVLHNDDYTTMAFVIDVLFRHFAKSEAEATWIMLQVHEKGLGIAGVYTRDVAETKVVVVTDEARSEGMPLRLTAEPLPAGDGEAA